MGRLSAIAKHRQCLVLRRRGEREKTDVGLAAAFGHAAKQLILAHAIVFGHIALRLFSQSLAAEDLFQVRCRFTTL